MPTEVWFRNPDNYVRELVECSQGLMAWDRGYLIKRAIDPVKHADLYFGMALPHRILVVGDQGTAELAAGRGMDNPLAVYPTWTYGEDANLLEEIISRPVGEDEKICSDKRVQPDERPVFGQQHRVVVTEIPPATTGPARKFLSFLKGLQEDYPNCIIHVHGLYAYRIAFGMGFRAADVEPRTAAKKGKLHMPSGQELPYERAQSNAKWITALGFKPADVAVPRNRCMYNIKSAVWAGEHYDELYNFQARGTSAPVDTETPAGEYKPPVTKSHLTKSGLVPVSGDKFHCDTCSLQVECKYFRSGAVCSVPGAEPTELARFFKTRDSDMIIDGLGTIVAAQTRRLERGMKQEEDFGELDPEVSKLLNAIFNQGVQLAKLVDPKLRGGVKVNVGIGVSGGAAAVSVSTPSELTGEVVRELEARGIPRDKITPELIMGILTKSKDDARAAIEGELIHREV